MKDIESLFKSNLKVINVGLDRFGDAMRIQHIPYILVEWKPPAGGNAELIELLNKLSN